MFDVTDDNSCVANGSTTSEILSADINVYRSGIGSTSCLIAGDYNPNHCYTGTRPIAIWDVSCSQNVGTCVGPDDITVTWTCTYPLWYVADPTDTNATSTLDSPFAAQKWYATAFAVDDGSASSSLVESIDADGAELQQFMQFSVGTTSIAYGSFQPNDGNASTSRPTSIFATGNTGLDEDVQAINDMCTTYPACTHNEIDTIPSTNQHFATSTVAYGSGTALSSTTPQEIDIDLIKTTSTTTPSTTNTYWGIFVPNELTLSGDYIGVTSIDGKVAETEDWTP